jgi:hypothetical protein
MPSTRKYQRTFVGGEVTPELAVLDNAKRENGARRIRNALPQPGGSVRSRPGTEFRGYAKGAAMLVPFSYGDTYNGAIEFGGNYARFWLDGGLVGISPTPPAFKATISTNGFTPIGGGTGVQYTRLTFGAPHGYTEGQRVYVTSATDSLFTYGDESDGALVTNKKLPYGFTAYVRLGSATEMFLSFTPTGPRLRFLWAGAVPITTFIKISTQYTPGQMVDSGGNLYSCKVTTPAGATASTTAPPDAATWHVLDPLVYEIYTPFTLAQAKTMDWALIANALVLTVPDVGNYTLKRITFNEWRLETLASMVAPLPAPTGLSVETLYGDAQGWFARGDTESGRAMLLSSATGGHGLIAGDWLQVLTRSGEALEAPGVAVGDFLLVERVRDLTSLFLRKTSVTGALQATVRATTSGTSTQLFSTTRKAPSTPLTRYYVTTLFPTPQGDYREGALVASGEVQNDLTVLGNKNRLTWEPVLGVAGYRIYKSVFGRFGRIGERLAYESTTFEDDGSTAVDFSVTPPRFDTATVASPARGVSFIEQRLALIGMASAPDSLLMSRPGKFDDFIFHDDVEKTDRIVAPLAGKENDVLEYAISLQQLLIITRQGEIRVTPQNDDALTPESVSVRPQSYVGCARVRPVVAGNRALFVGYGNNHVHEVSWAGSAEYQAIDASVYAAHLFDNQPLVQMAYVKTPNPCVFAVRSDGRLMSMLYMPEQSINPWALHETPGGKFLSVAPVREGNESVVWCVVERVIQGVTKYCVERLAPSRTLATRADSAFLDSHSVYNGWRTSPISITAGPGGVGGGATATAVSVTDLWPISLTGRQLHVRIPTGGIAKFKILSNTINALALEMENNGFTVLGTTTTSWGITATSLSGLPQLAETVATYVADGVVGTVIVAADGTATLPKPAVQVCIGRPYNCLIETLPIMVPNAEGFAAGRTKNSRQVTVGLFGSAGFKLGPPGGPYTSIDDRGGLLTAQVEKTLHGTWEADGVFELLQDQPLPMVVSGYAVEVEVGG